MKKNIFLIIPVIILIIISASIVGCKKGDKTESYTIGALYPMTGRAARYGEDSKAAALMAQDEINRAGGIKGKKISIIFRDSEANANRARQLAKEYILRDKVDFLMGVISSSAALAVTDVSKNYKKIFVGTDHASSKLTYEKFQPYYFRVSNNTYQSMAAQALFASENDWVNYYVIGPDYEYGHALWDDFTKLMNKNGKSINVVGESWPKLFEPDYTSYITAIKAADPDVIVANFWGGDMVAFLKQANSSNLLEDIPLMSVDAGGNYEVFEALGNSMPTNVILSGRHHNNWPETDGNMKYVKKFKNRTGRYPTYAAEGAYLGVYFIAEALKKVDDDMDSESIIKAMEGLEIKAPEDPDGFTSYIDPFTHQIVQKQAIGKVKQNLAFPPATHMLSEWKVYDAELLIPTKEEVEYLRENQEN